MSLKLIWFLGLTLGGFLAGYYLRPLINKEGIERGTVIPQPCDALTYSTACSASPSGSGALSAAPTTIQYIPADPLHPLGYGSVEVSNPSTASAPVDVADVALSVCTASGWVRVGVGHQVSCEVNLLDNGGLPGALAPGDKRTITIIVNHFSRRAKIELLDAAGAVLLTVPITS